jgi:predicted acetyltransferase
MSIEIRPAKPEELDDVHFVVSYSFSGDRSEAGRNKYRHVEEFANPTVLLDDGKIIASLRVYDLAMLINGAPVRMGGVSSVSCLPEHRRKGHIGRLLQHALSEMRDAGQPLSALYTPHPSLYRRYGWMVAAAAVKHTWHPKDVTTHDSAPAAGAARRITEEDWPVLDALYRRAVSGRTGYLDRDERWWKEAVFKMLYGREDKENRDVVVWFDDGGDPVGYMTYNSERSRGIESRSEKLLLWDFFALSRDAYNGLIRYINSHDLVDEVVWYAPPDDPLALAFDDSERVKRTLVDEYMLRVVDIGQAIAARPPALESPEGAFTVHITDASAPWNQGAWRIESSGGSLSATKADGTAQISTDAATFAALYDGFIRTTDAVRSGLAESSDPEAAALADRILASDHPPFGADFF